jgi:photosystem II stability/assembly factor-like uncharacterized protein
MYTRQVRRLLLCLLVVLGLGCVQASATTDPSDIGPWGFGFVAFASLPGTPNGLIGSIDERVEPYLSVDGGASWSLARNSVATTASSFLGSRSAPGTVWIGTALGELHVSHDGGRTSSELGAVPGWPTIGQIGRRGSLFVLGTSDGLARSTDGAHWSVVPFPTTTTIWVSEDGTALVVDVAGNVRRTIDGGETFANVALGPLRPGCFVGRSTIGRKVLHRAYMLDSCGHAWSSVDDGVSFAPLPDGPADTWSMAIDQTDGDVAYATTAEAVYRTSDGGLSWVQLPGSPTNARLVADVTHAGVVYAVTLAGLLRSQDHGATWRSIGPRITGARFVQSVARSSIGVLAGTTAGVLVLRAGQTAWEAAVGLPAAVNQISALKVDPSRPSVVLAVTSDSTGYHLDRSNDGGLTWSRVDAVGSQVSDVTFDQNTTGGIWVAASEGLYHTTDDGLTWAPTPVHAERVAVVTGSPDTLILGAPGGISRSDDAGQTSTPVFSIDEQLRADVVSTDPYHPGRVLAQYGMLLHKSDDGGHTWQTVPDVTLSWDFPPVYDSDRMTVFATDPEYDVLASVDGGATWMRSVDPTDPTGWLHAPHGIALLPGAPLAHGAAKARKGAPILYAARRTIVRRAFRPHLPDVRLARTAILASSLRTVRVRVVCAAAAAAAYCGGRLTMLQGGRVVGSARFAVPAGRRRRALTVAVSLRGARAGSVLLELRATTPWASRVVGTRRLTVR